MHWRRSPDRPWWSWVTGCTGRRRRPPSVERCCASGCASSRCGSTGICRARIAAALDKLRTVSTTPRIALVAGASGLVGGYLLNALLDAPDYTRVFALTRRPLGKEHPKLANRIVAFQRMADQLKGLAAHDAFCAIGTTIAEAGSQEAFRDADVNAVLL